MNHWAARLLPALKVFHHSCHCCSWFVERRGVYAHFQKETSVCARSQRTYGRCRLPDTVDKQIASLQAQEQQQGDLNWLKPEPRIPAVMTHPEIPAVRGGNEQYQEWCAHLTLAHLRLSAQRSGSCRALPEHKQRKHNHKRNIEW